MSVKCKSEWLTSQCVLDMCANRSPLISLDKLIIHRTLHTLIATCLVLLLTNLICSVSIFNGNVQTTYVKILTQLSMALTTLS